MPIKYGKFILKLHVSITRLQWAANRKAILAGEE